MPRSSPKTNFAEWSTEDKFDISVKVGGEGERKPEHFQNRENEILKSSNLLYSVIERSMGCEIEEAIALITFHSDFDVKC